MQKPKAQFEFLTENTQKHGSDKATIARIQMQLKRLGYDPGVVNGNLHKRTEGAVSKYRQDNGLADRKVSLSQLLSALSATPDDESLTPQDTDDDREGE
ncbi:MAG: peptidoglycan-binding domain-containing protein [Pseudomonadota bacterium]